MTSVNGRPLLIVGSDVRIVVVELIEPEVIVVVMTPNGVGVGTLTITSVNG